MSHDNNDLQVPDLGPADRSPAPLKVDQSEKKTHTELSATESNDGGWTTTLILVLLTTACSGLGYVGFGMQQTIVQQQQSLNSASERLNELEKLLNVANDSAVQTGQTLEQQLGAVNQDAAAKYTHYDSEIAKLWDVANKRNKAGIESLTVSLKSLSARVDKSESAGNELITHQQAQAKQFTSLAKDVAQISLLTSKVDAVDEQLSALMKVNSQLSKDQSAISKKQAQFKTSNAQNIAVSKKNITSLKQTLATLQTQIAVVEEALSEEQSNQLSSIKKLTRRISDVEKRPRSSGSNVESRVRVNEQAISAIDGTRRQINRDMMSLQRKVNALSVRMNKL
ncbi:hypothetical protein [Neptunomonas sp.]|uniref:hypothetical protein n=1 Tax=Neptunomonas sp. TaxID=1971898 RepID=UPI0025EF39A6|nr:hypothetical protein [Neptunomonas sp.]